MQHSVDDTFRAVSDSTRRRILDLLASGERSVGELCEHFDVSQPAISQQLRVLREAGLVEARREGRFVHYALTSRPLSEVFDWVSRYERFWTKRLDALGRVLDREAKKGKAH